MLHVGKRVFRFVLWLLLVLLTGIWHFGDF